MPSWCQVPKCWGNKPSGARPKRWMFSFPEDEELSRAWLRAIRKEDYTPNNSSRVCELHFRPEDIKGKVTRESLARERRPHLQHGAVPSLVLTWPGDSSGPAPAGESPDKNQSTKQVTMEKNAVHKENCTQKKGLHNLAELKEMLTSIDKYWTVIDNEEIVHICHVAHSPQPRVVVSVVFKPDSSLLAYVQGTRVDRLGEYHIPSEIKNISTLEELLNNLRMCDIEPHASSQPSGMPYFSPLAPNQTLCNNCTGKRGNLKLWISDS